jgi:hypothetical protein
MRPTIAARATGVGLFLDERVDGVDHCLRPLAHRFVGFAGLVGGVGEDGLGALGGALHRLLGLADSFLDRADDLPRFALGFHLRIVERAPGGRLQPTQLAVQFAFELVRIHADLSFAQWA